MDAPLAEIVYSVSLLMILVLSKMIASWLRSRKDAADQKQVIDLLEKVAEFAASEIERRSSLAPMESEEKKSEATKLVVQMLQESLSERLRSKFQLTETSVLVGGAIEKVVKDANTLSAPPEAQPPVA